MYNVQTIEGGRKESENPSLSASSRGVGEEMGGEEESIVEERGSSRITAKRKSISHHPSAANRNRECNETKTAVCRR